MPEVKIQSPFHGLARAGILAVALLAGWLYLWLRVDPSLIYHSQRRAEWFPAPPCERVFASDFVARPGGPVHYAMGYLSQLYFWPALGAGVLAAVAGLLVIASSGYLERTFDRTPRVLHLVPALLIALPFAGYSNGLGPALAVLTATAGAWAYARLSEGPPALRLGAFLALTVACYWVAGAASLLMATLCLLHEALARRWAAALACLCIGAVAPLAGAYAEGTSIALAYGRFLPGDAHFDPAGLAVLAPLYLALPAITVAGALVRAAASGLGAEAASEGSGRRQPILWTVCGLILILGLWGAALVVLDSPLIRTFARIDRDLEDAKWESVIGRIEGLDPTRFDRLAAWDLNRALYHAGRLPNEMFRFPQTSDGLMPLWRELEAKPMQSESAEAPRAAYLKCLDTMYELGRLNEAELVGHEAWEMVGEHPRVMRRLALINVAKGQLPAARAFLRDLVCDPVWGAWSRRVLARLTADPTLSDDAEVARLRRSRVTEDRNAAMTAEGMLIQLLDSRPDNRMAYEYLMAHYLLTRQLGKFVAEIGRLPQLGYAEMPTHYQEALSLYGFLAMKDMQVPGYPVRPQTEARRKEFFATMESCGGDLGRARQLLAGRHQGSYFFYYFFGPRRTDR
jgi:hypothetical protein